MDYRRYSVNRRDREPLLDFVLNALKTCGCRVIRHTLPTEAPFRISAEAPDGERFGIICCAFLANSVLTKNRPEDEHRFQLTYGPRELNPDGTPVEHELWQDQYGLYTTLLLGINTERGLFVGYDPVLHSPTKFYVSLVTRMKGRAGTIRPAPRPSHGRTTGMNVAARDHRRASAPFSPRSP